MQTEFREDHQIAENDANFAKDAKSMVYRWYALVLIMSAYAVHAMDRMIINVLIEPIKSEFHLSDSALGLLTGLGYAVPFALFGLPLGALADRTNRKTLFATLVALWSCFTAIGGLAQNFAMLLATRMAVGAAESGSPPTALSIISDYFPAQLRALAVSIFFFGAPLGITFGALLGGELTEAFNWRIALFAAGVPGIIIAGLILLTLREPIRGGLDEASVTEETIPISVMFRLIYKEMSLLLIVAALVFGALSSVGIAVWMPAVMMRSFGLPIDEVGRILALGGLFGGAGTLLGGVLSNVYAKGKSERLLLLSSLTIGLSVPVLICALLSNSLALFTLLYFAWCTIHVIYFGPGYSLMLGLVSSRIRGRMMAVTLILCNILGAGIGPQVAGVLSDLFSALGDSNALIHAVIILSLFAGIAGLLFLVALRFVSKGVARPLDTERLEIK